MPFPKCSTLHLLLMDCSAPGSFKESPDNEAPFSQGILAASAEISYGLPHPANRALRLSSVSRHPRPCPFCQSASLGDKMLFSCSALAHSGLAHHIFSKTMGEFIWQDSQGAVASFRDILEFHEDNTTQIWTPLIFARIIFRRSHCQGV